MRRNSIERTRPLVSCESLEHRRMMSATPGLAIPRAGTLTLTTQAATDRIIVKFDEPAIFSASLGAVQKRLADQVYTVQLGPGVDVAKAVAAFKSTKGVAYAEPDYMIQARAIPNDPDFTGLWGMNNPGGGLSKADADIDAPEAWGVSTGTGKTLVAVIDTGVDYTHPDLARNMWRNPGEISGNGIDDDNNGVVDDVFGADFFDNDGDPMDENGHGTHVAGTIGAVGNNGVGVAGVNWNAKIMALKAFGPQGGSLSAVIRCLDYAVRMGARISNHSWGTYFRSEALEDAIAKAGRAGHLLIAAAGNENNDNDGSFPMYPAAFANRNIVSVAATTREDTLAGFSNFGSVSVDVAAPGSQILSTRRGGGYQFMSGTSMAAPHVTGAISLIMDANPGMTAATAAQKVLANIDKLPDLQGKVATAGRLNVFKAIGTTAGPIDQPNAPTDLRVGSVTSDAVRLSWRDTSGNESGFRVYLSTADGSWTLAAATVRNQTAITVRGLSGSTSYQFRVCAVNQAGESQASNVVTATTSGSDWRSLLNLSVSAVTRSSFRASWTKPSGSVDRFEVWVKAGETWRRSETVSGDRNSAVIEYETSGGRRLKPGQTYQVRVRAIDRAGRPSDWSEQLTVRMVP